MDPPGSYRILTAPHQTARPGPRVAALCAVTLRNLNIVGRIGGEEFAVLLLETGRQRGLATCICRSCSNTTTLLS